MVNVAIKLMLRSIFINMSTGLVLMAVPFYQENGLTTGMQYNVNESNAFIFGLNGTISPGGEMQDKGNLFYRVLDLLNIGFIKKWANLVNTFLFGGLTLIYNIVAPLSGDIATLDKMFVIFKGAIIIFYGIAVFTMWTGRDPSQG
jgi:hypothetical protein